MGLLDNLFKPKPESSGEKSVESPGAVGSGDRNATAPAAGASSQKVSPFLAPKIYVPRSSVQIVPPTTRNQPPGERKLAPSADSPRMPGEIVVTLGDVLSRIPAHFLKKGTPDLRRELRFPADGLAADIARGRASVFLADIVAQCPDVFLPDANGFDAVQIRLPLQKLVEQIGSGIAKPESAPIAGDSPVFASAAPGSSPAGEAQIHLSLAVIMKRCPQEIIVRPVPPIAESIRVTFPFAPIERQLSTGQVEVSSLRFIAALPLDLMQCFEARAGVKVPLPLEEIFQNLPIQSQQPPAPLLSISPPAETNAANAPADVPDPERENARLAESILLEPMFEPLQNSEPEPAFPKPADAESILIELPQPVALASPVAVAATPVFQVPHDPAPEEIETFAAEHAGAEINRETPAPAPPAPAPPAPQIAEVPETDAHVFPEPIAPPREVSAFRRFVPALRPPIILQPGARIDEYRPEPVAPVEPEAPIPDLAPQLAASIATEPLEPEIADPLPARPFAAPVAESPAPVPAAPPPVTAATLRIAPPHFRPFVVHAPPIVFAPASEAAASPVGQSKFAVPEQVIAATETPPLHSAPSVTVGEEPLPEDFSQSTHAASANRERKKPSAPPQPDPIPEPVSPFATDGRVREYFPNHGPLTLARVSELLAALPGIHGCVLFSRSAETHSGQLPAGLDPAAIRDISQRMRGALADRAEAFRSGEVQHLTLHADEWSLSLFTRADACACAVHRARIFLPGVRERFAAVAEELARAIH